MKAHIREEKKTTPLKLGEGTLLQEKDGEIHKICDTAEYDETYTDNEIIKVALSEENMICANMIRATNFFNKSFVFTD